MCSRSKAYHKLENEEPAVQARHVIKIWKRRNYSKMPLNESLLLLMYQLIAVSNLWQAAKIN